MNRIKIAKILSLIATFFSVGGCIVFILIGLANLKGGQAAEAYAADEYAAMYVISSSLGVILGIVSYCFCGFGKAIRLPLSMAKWCLRHGIAVFVLPAFLIGIYVPILLPAIPVFKAAKEKTG